MPLLLNNGMRLTYWKRPDHKLWKDLSAEIRKFQIDGRNSGSIYLNNQPDFQV